MTEESKPYAILGKDFNPETQEWTHPAEHGDWCSSTPRYGDGWIVVRDKPKLIALTKRLNDLIISGFSPAFIALLLTEEGYATEYPK